MPDNQPVNSDQAPVASDNETANQAGQNQSLATQSIFTLLGVTTATEDEKEQFLDRLEKTVWDDFLDNDVDLMLTEDEKKPLVDLLNRTDLDETQKQTEMVNYLEKIVPSLEDILMEKALKLKGDLVRERVRSLEELYQGDGEKLAAVYAARDLMEQDKWFDASSRLNQI